MSSQLPTPLLERIAEIYNSPPEEVRFDVRIPLFDDEQSMDDDLLVQLDDFALSQPAQRRKRAIASASLLPVEVLQRWATYGVDALNQLADELPDIVFSDPDRFLWRGFPNFDQIEATFELVWGRLDFEKHGIWTPRQLAFFANTLYGSETVRAYLETLVHKRGEAAQPEIDQALNFLRGAEFTFPQVLRALNDILDAVIEEGAAEYRAYAQQLQNLFLAPGLRGLDEFGVPIPLVAKLGLEATDDVRGLLRAVSSPDFAGRLKLSAFENELLSASVGRV
jgi:hypothetical protein